jgi:hypothetical protein
MGEIALKEKIQTFGSLFLQNALRIKFMTENDFESLSFLAVDRYLRSKSEKNFQAEEDFFDQLSSVIEDRNNANRHDSLPRNEKCTLDCRAQILQGDTVETSHLLRGSNISSLRSQSPTQLYQSIRKYFSVHEAQSEILVSKEACLKNDNAVVAR